MIGTVSKVMAGCFALTAFAVAIVAGMAGENSATHVLSRALMAMILCYPVGLIAGMVCERVIAERVREHAQENVSATGDENATPAGQAIAGTSDDEEVFAA